MSLQQQFDDAGIPVVISTIPLFGNSEEAKKVFQMSIRTRRIKRGKPKEEFVEIYQGEKTNEIHIINSNKDFHQVILSVNEKKRTFTFTVPDRNNGSKMVTRTQTTPDWRRTYLVGMDQVHLFIAELPKGASTVPIAHDILKPVKAKGNKNVKRQGEWFFIPATPSEGITIENVIKEIGIKKNAGIPGNTHNIHVAEELVTDGKVIFVRGKISHPEHLTLKLNKWCSVVRNTVRQSGTVQGQVLTRIGYID